MRPGPQPPRLWSALSRRLPMPREWPFGMPPSRPSQQRSTCPSLWTTRLSSHGSRAWRIAMTPPVMLRPSGMPCSSGGAPVRSAPGCRLTANNRVGRPMPVLTVQLGWPRALPRVAWAVAGFHSTVASPLVGPEQTSSYVQRRLCGVP